MEHSVFLAFEQVNAKLDALMAGQSNLAKLEASAMKTIQDVVQAVNQETTLVGGVQALLVQLKQQIADGLANQITPEIQAAIDAAFDTATANNQALADAITANTPAAPAPAPVP